MYLKLIHHDYKYAVEQIMLILFPGEKPDYGEAPEGASQATSSLSVSQVWATARTRLRWQGREAVAVSRVPVKELTDQLTRDRLLQRIIKPSFYKAAVECTGITPP